tara:strand:+ start:1534 stop:1818 length:285 start_codon:yes stop_codon:yes gene_type:complete
MTIELRSYHMNKAQELATPNIRSNIMGFKPIIILSKSERYTNAQVFETNEEANSSALARFRVWTMANGYDTEETCDAVNYRWDRKIGDVPLSRQ